MMNVRSRVPVIGAALSILVGLLAPCTQVYARDVMVTEFCNVTVTFKATVPDSVEQGQSFTMTNITVQPANTYGFTVTSSVFKMSATNTSSTNYSQDFYKTDPSPTTGHSTEVSYYPNWLLPATGDPGSSVTIKLISTQTVVQGYGNVNCSFTKTLASVPITAHVSSGGGSTSGGGSAGGGSTSSGGTSSGSSSGSKTSRDSTSGTSTKTTTETKKDPSKTATDTDTSKMSDQPAVDESVTVVPLNIDVKDSSGARVKGAVVTLDGSQKLTTDAAGRVTFPNVLTGNHAVLVSYKGQKINRNIQLTTDAVGSAVTVSLPPTSHAPLLAIVGGIVAFLVVAGAAGLFVMKRRQAVGQPGEPAISLPGIIDGLAVPAPGEAAITHIPAVPAFEPRPTIPSPAPWTPPALVQPEVPAQTPAPSQPPVVQPPVPQQPAQGPVSIPVVQMPSAPSVVPSPVETPPLQPTDSSQSPITPQTPLPNQS